MSGGCTPLIDGIGRTVGFACTPRYRDYKAVYRCPTCECRTEHVYRDERWYGTTVMCTRCGDNWQDGELGPRPFYPRWRRDRVRKYRRLYDAARHMPRSGIPWIEDDDWYGAA